MKRRSSLRSRAARRSATKTSIPKEGKWITRVKYDDYDKNRSFAPVKHQSSLDRAGAWVSNHKLLVAGGVVAAAFVFMPRRADASTTTTTTTTEVERRTQQGQSDGLKLALGAFAVISVATIVYMNIPTTGGR